MTFEQHMKAAAISMTRQIDAHLLGMFNYSTPPRPCAVIIEEPGVLKIETLYLSMNKFQRLTDGEQRSTVKQMSARMDEGY